MFEFCDQVLEGLGALFEQSQSLCALRFLSGSGNQSERVAQWVAQPVQFGRKAAARVAQRLVVLLFTGAGRVLMGRTVDHDVLGVGLFAEHP